MESITFSEAFYNAFFFAFVLHIILYSFSLSFLSTVKESGCNFMFSMFFHMTVTLMAFGICWGWRNLQLSKLYIETFT